MSSPVQRSADPQLMSWPRPQAGWAACIESGGRWLAILLAGLALAALLLLGLQAQQAQALRDARLAVALHDIQERLETDLALGFDLQDSTRAQSLLEDALAQDSSLLAAEVFDAAGVSRFNTDRGSIGERVPAAWLEAITLQVAPGERTHRPWRAGSGGDLTLGAPVRGPFGEVAGHVSLSSAPVQRPAPLAFVAASAATAAALLLLALLGLKRSLRQALAAGDQDLMEQAAQRLALTHARLDRALDALIREDGGTA